MTYILFDIGGTKTRIALSCDLVSLEKTEHFKTPVDFTAGVKKIVETITALTDEKKIL